MTAGPFNIRHLTDGSAGPATDIEVTVLRNCAAAVDTALVAHATAEPTAPGRARPFPTLGTVGPAAPLPDPTQHPYLRCDWPGWTCATAARQTMNRPAGSTSTPPK